jgi:hypothetical protein
LKKEILSDDFKKRKIFWKNISENFPYGKNFYGKFSTSHHYWWPQFRDIVLPNRREQYEATEEKQDEHQPVSK